VTDSAPDTSQQRAAVDPEAHDSLIHRVQVTQLLRIGSALGVGVLVAALAPGWRDDGARDLRPWPRPLPGAVSVSDATDTGQHRAADLHAQRLAALESATAKATADFEDLTILEKHMVAL